MEKDIFLLDKKHYTLSEVRKKTFEKSFITFNNVSKNYKSSTIITNALSKVSFSVKEGELVLFLGPSGAGKTTALNLLGGMDNITFGNIIVDGKNISNLTDNELREYRKDKIGFVFQSYNLIPNLTVSENILLATKAKKIEANVDSLLKQVGLYNKKDRFPYQLSIGEQQRIAVIRAIAKKPQILLCDEPTGSLDSYNSERILSLIKKYCKKNKITTIIITHNQSFIQIADRIVCFNSGKIQKVYVNKKNEDVHIQ